MERVWTEKHGICQLCSGRYVACPHGAKGLHFQLHFQVIHLQVLGYLIRGRGEKSLLSHEAIEKVLSIVGGSVFSSSSQQKAAFLACLEICLFSAAVWGQGSGGPRSQEDTFILVLKPLVEYIFSECQVSSASFHFLKPAEFRHIPPLPIFL